MKIIIIVVLLTFAVHGLNAQWRKLSDFEGTDGSVTFKEIITSVYFLDLPGPPRIGFVGTESDLYKTTDGGKNWRSVWDSNWSFDNYFVTDICFKDSLIGWFTVFGGQQHEACYRTTDGGETWSVLTVPNSTYGAGGVYYVGATNRLLLSLENRGALEYSTDLGDTWQIYPDTAGRLLGPTTFEFFSPLIGILGGGGAITTDGGVSWSIVEVSNGGGTKALPIPGTSTCFLADYSRLIIRRSDDFGKTWRILKDFGPVVDTNGNPILHPGPYGTGAIEGSLSRLFVQTMDSGMYVSTDQGITWVPDGGPSWCYHAEPFFYAAKDVTIAGGTLP